MKPIPPDGRDVFLSYCEHPDYLALLAGILENPFDSAHPLVMADWLDEHGAEYRARFIRKLVLENAWNPDTLNVPFDEVDKLHEDNPTLRRSDWVGYRFGFCQNFDFDLMADLLPLIPLASKVCPVVLYRAFDRRPAQTVVKTKKKETEVFAWNQESYSPDVSGIPADVFRELKKYRFGSRQANYPTKTEAKNDLWDACVSCGRTLNKLPKLVIPEDWK